MNQNENVVEADQKELENSCSACGMGSEDVLYHVSLGRIIFKDGPTFSTRDKEGVLQYLDTLDEDKRNLIKQGSYIKSIIEGKSIFEYLSAEECDAFCEIVKKIAAEVPEDQKLWIVP